MITGASGLIGSRLCAALGEDYLVVGLDRDPPADPPEGSHFLVCDLCSDEAVQGAMQEIRRVHGPSLASVVHLAAYYDFSGEPSPLYHDLTVEGTRRMLDALEGFAVGQFVFSSSMLVMRPSVDGTPIDEDGPLEAEWAYPRSKVEAEQVISAHPSAFPKVVLRIAGVYDDMGHSIPIAQQIRRIHEKELESHMFPGNPDHGQAFIHVEDLCACIHAVVEARGKLHPHEVFMVGEPQRLSYDELQDRIGSALHGRSWTTIRIPAPVAKAGAWLKDKLPFGEDAFIKPWMIDLADADYPVAITKAERVLSWRPGHSLRRDIDTILAKLVEDPEAWYEANGLPTPDGVRHGGP
ncbi:MAG: NAD(P)-dependent oxidoreductase [Planctomycetota bacterium]